MTDDDRTGRFKGTSGLPRAARDRLLALSGSVIEVAAKHNELARGLAPEFIGRLHHDMRRCRDKVFRLQDAVNP